MTDTAEVQPATDGRVQRRLGNHAALLKAGLDMALRGHWHASAADVAKAAGVSTRTFFTAFGGLDEYREELIKVHGASLWAEVGRVEDHAVESEHGLAREAVLRLVLLGKSTPA